LIGASFAGGRGTAIRRCSYSFKRRVLTALDRSLDRNVPDAEPQFNAGEAMWW